jgi:hypothetical protein
MDRSHYHQRTVQVSANDSDGLAHAIGIHVSVMRLHSTGGQVPLLSKFSQVS